MFCTVVTTHSMKSRSIPNWPLTFHSARRLRRLCQHLGPLQQEAIVSVPPLPDQHRLTGLQQWRHHARHRCLLHARERGHQSPRGCHLHPPGHRRWDEAQVSGRFGFAPSLSIHQSLSSRVQLWSICWSVSASVHASISDSWEMSRLRAFKAAAHMCPGWPDQ